MRVLPHQTAWLPSLIATFEPARRARRPALGLDVVAVGERRVAVRQTAELQSPFFRLVHFAKDAARQGPPLLVVAPLSGHFSALLRDMLAGFLAGYDLHLLEWQDARDVAPDAGEFGLEDNISAILDCIRHLAGELHVVGLCQSAMPTLAATALLAARHDAPPVSLILLNGMIDTRLGPTRIDRIAARRSPAWFRQFALATVPPPYPGAGRHIYPATMQHAALVTYLMRHAAIGGETWRKVVDDDGLDASAHPFLEAYLSVMDLPAEFFLDSLRLVFQEYALPRGRLAWRGAAVDLAAIRTTALMTVEGEFDDVSGPGQTRVAHTLCRNVPRARRAHYLQPGVGHFGTFHGALWRREVLPRLDGFIRDMR